MEKQPKASRIDVWHGFGSLIAEVSHDGESGNAAATSLAIDFSDNSVSIDLSKDNLDRPQVLSISIAGSCERSGLAELFRAIAEELDKPADALGGKIRIGHEDEYRDEVTHDITIAVKGEIGERRLNEWMQAAGLSYLYINQAKEVFARIFSGTVKRPDFLMLLESIGLIAVDAKNYALHRGEFTLPLETELRRVLTFERLFRIPVWYAYLQEKEGGATVWYWISALKAIEVGQVRKNSKTGEDFVAIKLEHFERIEKNEDLGKLYTHRLPSLNGLHKA
ncbi:MAG: hypothetical protein M0006_09895 [Magnetospirillum sp.]|nr:hypothetical protein [Magnetospirillum sp.]